MVILRSANNRRCAKHFTRAANGEITAQAYDRESHWFPDVIPIPDFGTLCRALGILVSFSDRIIVRGALREAPTGQAIMRRSLDPGATLRPAARSWVALDIDGLPVLGVGLETVLSFLPPRFRTAACFYHYTSSHGLRPGLRVRLWYLLSHPMTDAAWKRELRPFAIAAHLDLSLFNPVQPHYIGAPTFAGMDDPLPSGRSGVHDPSGATSVVDVSDIPARDEMDEATVVISSLTRTNIVAHPDQIATVLTRFNNRTRSASRHSTAVALIGELYGHGLSGEEAVRIAGTYMAEQGRPAERGELERALAFIQRRADAGVLRTNDMPVSLMFQEAPPGPAVELPRPTEETLANIAAAEEAVSDWPTAPLSLARRINTELFHREGYVRWSKQDYEWYGTHWRPFSDDEELGARILRAADCTPTCAERAATALRQLCHRADLTPPCGLRDRIPLLPRVCTQSGWLSVAAVRRSGTQLPPVQSYHPEQFDVLSPMPVSYDPAAAAPRFSRWLEECFEGDEESKLTLIKLMGYLLFAGNEYQRVFILSGPPSSGKSTWLRIMYALLGTARAVTGDVKTLSGDFGLGDSYMAQVIFFPELSHGDDGGMRKLEGMAVDQLKRISGADPVRIQRKNRPDVWATTMPTPVILCNLPPIIRDEAFIRRLVTIHWPHSFVGREDPTLTARLKEELPGILNVALQGLMLLGGRRDPFPPPAAPRARAVVVAPASVAPAPTSEAEASAPTPVAAPVVEPELEPEVDMSPARELYEQIRAESSPAAEFCRQALTTHGAAIDAFIGAPELYARYRRWCAATQQRSLDERQFTARLPYAHIPGAAYTRRRVDSVRVRGFEGVTWTDTGRQLATEPSVF